MLDFVFNHCGKRCQLVKESGKHKLCESLCVCVCACHGSCMAGCTCRCILSKEEVFLHGGRVQAAWIQGSYVVIGVVAFSDSSKTSFHVRSLPVVFSKQSPFSES